MLPRRADDRDVRIVVGHSCPPLFQQVEQPECGGLAQVVHIRLVGQTQGQDSAAVGGFPARIQGFDDPMEDVFGHGRVDLAGQLDESRALSILPRLPGQVKRIDGNAVSTQARTGIECHVAEWLGLGGVNDLP